MGLRSGRGRESLTVGASPRCGVGAAVEHAAPVQDRVVSGGMSRLVHGDVGVVAKFVEFFARGGEGGAGGR